MADKAVKEAEEIKEETPETEFLLNLIISENVPKKKKQQCLK